MPALVHGERFPLDVVGEVDVRGFGVCPRPARGVRLQPRGFLGCIPAGQDALDGGGGWSESQFFVFGLARRFVELVGGALEGGGALGFVGHNIYSVSVYEKRGRAE